MKALSVKNPWAWAIIHGGKDVENRTWTTTYRGPILIHASKSWADGAAHNLMVQRALERVGRDIAYPTYEARGVILGQVELVDCVEDSESLWAEKGAWHWVLQNPRPLLTPIPVKGSLGLWDYPVGPLGLVAP